MHTQGCYQALQQYLAHINPSDSDQDVKLFGLE